MRWLARGEHEVPDDDAWLAPTEAARSAGYRFTKRRTEYRLRRWAGKQAVAAMIGHATDPASLAAIEVLNRPGGAPFARVDGQPLGMDISLTDRAGWAVCLVGERGPAAVGVDLELVEPRSRGFVEDFLTAGERDYVLGLPSTEDKDVAANVFWSAKESALKVLRTGLRADTRSVEVRWETAARPDGWAPLRVDRVGDPAGRWFPGWWRRDGSFVLTVTSQVPAEPPILFAAASADLSAAVPVHSWLAHPLTR